jgi:2-dehydro-3-deoxyphosphogluconate aldolase/(4S)-4-hydroxy-2-oxoglutarate aldolase
MNPVIPEVLERQLEKAGIIAVLVMDDAGNAVRVARTLLDNGVTAMELTLRTEAALESLQRIIKEVPEMNAGVGTILKKDQLADVKQAGASFGVAPGYNAAIVEHAQKIGLPFAPGIATPSEIEGAVSQGCRILKYFHAEGMGGTRYLKGIHAPYGFLKLRYIPLGGLKLSNIREYLEMPEIIAIGGSWIAPRNVIHNEDWDRIAQNAADAVKILHEVRGYA